jgi:VanZ family protein
MLLIVVGISFGDTNGILLLVPIFLLFSILERHKTNILYSLIPIAYLMLSAFSYSQKLGDYAAFVYVAFSEFLKEVIAGHLPERAIPWQKSTGRAVEDTQIASAAYLSLIALSLIVVVVLTYLYIKERKKTNNSYEKALGRASLLCFVFLLGITAVTYFATSEGPERSIADIRTITIVLLSMLLPFLFISKRLLAYSYAKKALLFFVTILIVLASMRTVYEIYPKCISDQIYVVEDYRLGSTSVYATVDFLIEYYKSGGITGDYKILNRMSPLLSGSEYETRRINEKTINEAFSRFPNRSLVVFNIAGTVYPSMYDTPDAYAAAYNYSINHNRLYDNGVTVIASQLEGTP